MPYLLIKLLVQNQQNKTKSFISVIITIVKIRQYIMPSKLHTKWGITPDNSILRRLPSQQQINHVYQFCSSFDQYQSSFVMLSYNLAPQASLSQLTYVQSASVLSEVIDGIYENGYVLIDTLTDHEFNYKGVISFVLLAFNNRGYVVDGFALHRELKQLKKIVEDPKITKYCYRLNNFLQDAKREWQAFGMNFFDFQLLEKSIGFKKSTVIDQSIISERPAVPQITQYFQQRYDNMIRYLHQIRYFLEMEQGQEYSIYFYSNHYQFLLKQYEHKQSNLSDQQKRYTYLQSQKNRRMKQNKENNIYYNSHEENGEARYPVIENNQQKFVAEILIQWREHVAKMLDCQPKKILTFQQILIIVVQRPNSIFQIQETFEDMSLCTVEKASSILQLISLAAQQQENLMNDLQIRLKKNKEQKNIKSLLSELKWQGREEWLNRKNDESIRLYKEIVSIVELDGSIVEQFEEGMTKGVVSCSQIGRFVKYAEYFRNCNHRKLKEYYQSIPPLANNSDKEEFFGWQSDEQQSFITGTQLISSQTSIIGSCEKLPDKNQNHTLTTIRSRSSMNSLADLDFISSKVQSLPQNIQQIYLKAVSVKKNYQKVQKKKAGRKQGKDEGEQFVPSWQQIKMLLQA